MVYYNFYEIHFDTPTCMNIEHFLSNIDSRVNHASNIRKSKLFINVNYLLGAFTVWLNAKLTNFLTAERFFYFFLKEDFVLMNHWISILPLFLNLQN